MYPILSLTELQALAKEKAIENQEFRLWVKKHCANQVFDKLIHEISAEVSAKTDCTKCANCCKYLEAEVSITEIQAFAEVQQMEIVDFQKKYVQTDPQKRLHFFVGKPCHFLQENKCSIYEIRPLACADFPHLHYANMKYRMKTMLENYTLCPIVFYTLETLKKNLPYQSLLE
ncbi:MAG: YkgJ family cysteine cluster protein [Bacteroidia bacterium]